MLRIFVLQFLLLVSLTGCIDPPLNKAPDTSGAQGGAGDDGTDAPEEGSSEKAQSLLEVVAKTSELSSLERVVGFVDQNGSQPSDSDLSQLLSSSSSSYTVFTPSNAAFDTFLDLSDDGVFNDVDLSLLVSTLGSATAAADALYLVVANHVVSSKIFLENLSDGSPIGTLAGSYTPTSNFGLQVSIPNRTVSIIPSFVDAKGDVVFSDVEASNGVAHIINSILIDESTASALGLVASSAELPDSLVQVVNQTSELSSLATVIDFIDDNGSQANAQNLAAILGNTLEEYTVFAPSNAAFDKWLDLNKNGTFDSDDVNLLVSLLGDATTAADALYLVVANHVTLGKTFKSQLSNSQKIDTLAGDYGPTSNFGLNVVIPSLTTSLRPSFNEAQADIVFTDVEAKNGVAHIINSVLIDLNTANALGLISSGPTQNLAELITSASELTSLASVVSFIDNNGSQASSENLASLLSDNSESFTVFTPSNQAFDQALDLNDDGQFTGADVTLLSSALGGDTNAADALYLVVANHVLAQTLEEQQLEPGENLDTLAGDYSVGSNFGLSIQKPSLAKQVVPSFAASRADIILPDVQATNGVAHVIDFILLDDNTAQALGL